MRKFHLVSNPKPTSKLPKRATKNSAGYDFFFNGENIVEIAPGASYVVVTDVKVELEERDVLILAPRSSYGYKYGMVLANTIGVIDSDYFNNQTNEGNISIKVINKGDNALLLKPGEAFAQGIITNFFITDDDDTTDERVGGVGSTTKQ